MSHLPWMPLYIGDELAETAHLTAEEFGAYLSLKMHYWQHGGLPQNEIRLARISRAGNDRWPEVKESIMGLFFEGWRLPRLEEQRISAEETHQKRSEAGRKGGRPRKDEKPGNNPGYKPSFTEEKAGPKQPQPQPQPQPYSYSEEHSDSPPQKSALEGNRDTYTHTREGSEAGYPYDPPESVDEGRAWLSKRNITGHRAEAMLQKLMRGVLMPSEVI